MLYFYRVGRGAGIDSRGFLQPYENANHTGRQKLLFLSLIHISIIAMTANAFDEDARESIQYGMNGHLSKPFTMDRLLEVLSECL